MARDAWSGLALTGSESVPGIAGNVVMLIEFLFFECFNCVFESCKCKWEACGRSGARSIVAVGVCHGGGSFATLHYLLLPRSFENGPARQPSQSSTVTVVAQNPSRRLCQPRFLNPFVTLYWIR